MIEVVFGKNSRAVHKYVEHAQTQLEKKYKDNLAIERIDATGLDSVGELEQSLSSGSLFHSQKLVIIRDVTKQKNIADWVAENIDRLNTADAYVYCAEQDLDKRSKFYKSAKKADVLQEFGELNAQEAASFAVQYVKEQGGTLSHRDADLLVARVGLDQGLLANELDKLLLFNRSITEQTITELTEQTPSDSIFALTDAVVQGRASGAIDMYRDLRARQMHPLEIIATLGWQMYTLVQINLSGNSSQQEIAKATKLHPYVVGKNMALARRLSRQQLSAAVSTVADLEEQLKTSDAGLADHSFETALLKLIEQLKS